MEGSNIHTYLGGLGVFKALLTEMIHTHVCKQKPYLLWIRDLCTLKLLHVFEIRNNFARNIKCDTFQSDTLQVLLGIIAYVQRRMEKKQTRAPLVTNLNA